MSFHVRLYKIIVGIIFKKKIGLVMFNGFQFKNILKEIPIEFLINFSSKTRRNL